MLLIETKGNTREIKKDGEIDKSATCEISKLRWECDQVMHTRVLYWNNFVCRRAAASKTDDDDRMIRQLMKGGREGGEGGRKERKDECFY